MAISPEVNAQAIAGALSEAVHKIDLAISWMNLEPIPESQWQSVARAAQDLHRKLGEFELALAGVLPT